MRPAIILFALGVALLAAPSRSEPGRPRAAEAYAERVVGAGLLEIAPAVPSSLELPSVVSGGRRRGEVGPLDVAAALPGALAARAFGAADPALVAAARAIGGTLLSALCLCTLAAVFFARLARTTGLDLGTWRSALVTLALLSSTAIVLGARRADASLFAALVLLLLLDQLAVHQRPTPTPPRHFVQVGLLGAALAVAMPAYAVCALALALLDVLRRHRAGGRWVGRVLLALAPIVGAVLLTHVWNRAVALEPEPSGARLHALFGLLLSPGRSVFVYSPLAALGVIGLPRLWARDRARAEGVVIALVTVPLAVAARADWHGEPGFGPTQLLPLVPLLVEAAALLLESGRRAQLGFAAVVTLGIGVQVLGIGARVEAWPRLLADLRGATGAPAWFLDPQADTEFVPQLTPVAGHALMLRAAFGRPLPVPPPFALVVASDQAEVPRSQTLDVIWPTVWERFDKSLLVPNLAVIDAPRSVRWGAGSLALGWMAAGAFLLVRARSQARRASWRRG